jgi:Fe-S-cluster containining protein
VNCRIYEWRSSTCRDFVVGSVACNDARRRWGLLAV